MFASGCVYPISIAHMAGSNRRIQFNGCLEEDYWGVRMLGIEKMICGTNKSIRDLPICKPLRRFILM